MEAAAKWALLEATPEWRENARVWEAAAMGAEERSWEWQMTAVVVGDRVEPVAAVHGTQAEVEAAGWTSAAVAEWAR